MATGLTIGRFYLIESEAAQQDWITNNAGDPDAIDLDQFTEGTHYISLELPMGFTKNSFTGAIVTPSGGGKSFVNKNAARFYKMLQRGFQSSLANANLVDKFVMSDRHTSGDSATFKWYYAIFYFGTNSHLEFTDGNSDPKSYGRGIVLNVATQWVEHKSLRFNLRINWESVW